MVIGKLKAVRDQCVKIDLHINECMVVAVNYILSVMKQNCHLTLVLVYFKEASLYLDPGPNVF